jgi:hypothetical protein
MPDKNLSVLSVVRLFGYRCQLGKINARLHSFGNINILSQQPRRCSLENTINDYPLGSLTIYWRASLLSCLLRLANSLRRIFFGRRWKQLNSSWTAGCRTISAGLRERQRDRDAQRY